MFGLLAIFAEQQINQQSEVDPVDGHGRAGRLVVSGMARGIDAAAHEGALATGTVAVLGGGVADIYPPEHGSLYERLVQEGCVVSERPPTYRAQARDFPRRNRIISGLSRAVVVVEAELKSPEALKLAATGVAVVSEDGHVAGPNR